MAGGATTTVPTAIKKLRGTDLDNPGRVNHREPQVEGVVSEPPLLSEAGRLIWAEVVPFIERMKVLQPQDSFALQLLVEAMADYVIARDALAKEERYYTTESENGSIMMRSHPALVDRDNAWRRVRYMLQDFGSTPASRTRVQTVLEDDGDDLDKWARGA